MDSAKLHEYLGPSELIKEGREEGEVAVSFHLSASAEARGPRQSLIPQAVVFFFFSFSFSFFLFLPLLLLLNWFWGIPWRSSG